MNNVQFSKILTSSFILTLILFTSGWMPGVHCELRSIDEKALIYVENVLPIDFSSLVLFVVLLTLAIILSVCLTLYYRKRKTLQVIVKEN